MFLISSIFSLVTFKGAYNHVTYPKFPLLYFDVELSYEGTENCLIIARHLMSS